MTKEAQKISVEDVLKRFGFVRAGLIYPDPLMFESGRIIEQPPRDRWQKPYTDLFTSVGLCIVVVYSKNRDEIKFLGKFQTSELSEIVKCISRQVHIIS